MVKQPTSKGNTLTSSNGGTVAGFVAALVVGALLIVGIGYWWGSETTPADKIGLSYGGGPFEGKAFQGIHNPGSGIFFNGLADELYLYPVTQRDASITSDGEAEDKDYGMPDSITGRTSDGVDCIVELVATFKVNTNKVREFHETIGLKYKAWEDEGWGKLLFKNVLPSLSSATYEQCGKFDANTLAKDSTAPNQMALGIAENLKDNINASMGVDDMFCGPEFKMGKDKCPEFEVVVKSIRLPDNVKASLEKQVVAANNSITVQTEAENNRIKAQGETDAAAARAAASDSKNLDFLKVEAMKACAENPNPGACVMILGAGDGVNVNVGP